MSNISANTFLDDQIVWIEDDWNRNTFPEIERVENHIQGLETLIALETRLGKNLSAQTLRVATLKTRVEHSYTNRIEKGLHLKEVLPALEAIGQKCIEIIHKVIPPSFFEVKPRSLPFLAPVASALVLGSYFFPSCRYGVLAAVIDYTIIAIMRKRKPRFDVRPAYSVHNNYTGPLMEELMFRGILQNGITLLAGRVLGIAISASIFGAAHVMCRSRTDRLIITNSAMYYGILNLQFGIFAAIAAHTCTNLLITSLNDSH